MVVNTLLCQSPLGCHNDISSQQTRGGGRWVSFWWKGWLVSLSYIDLCCVDQRYTYCGFEDKYWYWILHQRHKRMKKGCSSLQRLSLDFSYLSIIDGYIGVKSYLEKRQHRTTTIYNVELQCWSGRKGLWPSSLFCDDSLKTTPASVFWTIIPIDSQLCPQVSIRNSHD